MKTRKSPRWYYEGRAILVLAVIIAATAFVGYTVISCVSDYHANYWYNHRNN